MQIANIKSNQDLQAKRNLQKEILALEVSNEQENQRRRKEAGITTYEPAKILAQYRTSAEIQADRMSGEGEARKHLEELGFGFQDASKIVAWLSSSTVNRLNDFNANAKGIKNEIKNNFSPVAFLNTQFIENFLERYFDDLDVNYGKKFGIYTPIAKSIDELDKILPDIDALQKLYNQLVNIGSEVSDRDTVNSATIIAGKVKVLISSTPTPEMISSLKTVLNQNERTKLSKRLSALLAKNTSITKSETEEISNQIELNLQSKRPRELQQILFKLDKLLSTVGSNKFVNAVKFTDDYLNEIDAKNRANFQESNLSQEIEDAKEVTVINLDELKATETQIFNLDETVKQKVPQKDRDKGKKKINIREEALKIEYKVLPSFIGGVTVEEVIISIIEEVKKVSDSEETAKEIFNEIFEDVTNIRDKNIPVEQQAQIMSDILSNDTRAEQVVSRVIESAGEQLADVELAGVSDERKIEIDADEVVRQLKKIADKNFRGYTDGGKSKKAFIISEIRKAHPEDPEEIKNLEVLTISLLYEKLRGLEIKKRTQSKVGKGIAKKLKKHFKEDEKLLNKVVRKLEEDSSSDEETVKLLKGHSRRTAKADKKLEKFVGKGWFSDAVVKHLHDEQEKKEDQERKTFGFSPVGDTIGRIGKGAVPDKPLGVSFNAKRIPVGKVGKGVDISEQENPTYRTFGKYRIHVPQLLNNNTANFKYPSLGGIPTLKPQTISQDYKDFLIELLNTGKFSEKELKRLPQKEIKHFERVAIGAGLVEKFGLKVGDNDEDRKDAERFEVLKGEYLAGNNNEKMLKELRQLIVKFINTGRIIKSEGMNLLLQLSTL